MTKILELVRERFGFSPIELENYIKTAPFRYKTYKIKKRTKGTREISQPSKDLKVLQRYVLNKFLEPNFVYHDCATAYREGRSIVDNVRPHLENPYLLKMDFEEFFPSIKSIDFERFLLNKGLCSAEVDAEMIAQIFFKRSGKDLVLSIGSPGSPSISNALLFELDEKITALASRHAVAYTRYSDDLSFSTKTAGELAKFEPRIRDIIHQHSYPTLNLNPEKTVFSSMKFNRHITGITISNEGEMSLGHQRKRELRTKVYESSKLRRKKLLELKGYLSFVEQIEPMFAENLRRRYPEQMARISGASFQ
jgi:hypothetical protein